MLVTRYFDIVISFRRAQDAELIVLHCQGVEVCVEDLSYEGIVNILNSIHSPLREVERLVIWMRPVVDYTTTRPVMIPPIV